MFDNTIVQYSFLNCRSDKEIKEPFDANEISVIDLIDDLDLSDSKDLKLLDMSYFDRHNISISEKQENFYYSTKGVEFYLDDSDFSFAEPICCQAFQAILNYCCVVEKKIRFSDDNVGFLDIDFKDCSAKTYSNLNVFELKKFLFREDVLYIYFLFLNKCYYYDCKSSDYNQKSKYYDFTINEHDY